MTIRIAIDQVMKKYGDHIVIRDLNLTIKRGELFTILGPSGCGKSTLLRMIAGFIPVDQGTIAFNDQIINDVPPHQRNVGMVFQNYAIFPHMTAWENVAFGLKNKRVKEPNLSKKVKEILNQMHILPFKDHYPHQMSGGQQQRLAIARAIVTQPDVLLMDEPLSNLDAKLRIEMRELIKNIQRKYNITTIYVTHDQEEALAISDRIAIMNDGKLQQVGKPFHVYLYPENIFVAQFIGNHNLLNGTILKKGDSLQIQLENGYTYDMKDIPKHLTGREVLALIRPSEFLISEERGMKGLVIDQSFLGIGMEYKVQLENERVIEILEPDLTKDMTPLHEEIYVQIHPSSINIYDRDSGNRLLDRKDVNET